MKVTHTVEATCSNPECSSHASSAVFKQQIDVEVGDHYSTTIEVPRGYIVGNCPVCKNNLVAIGEMAIYSKGELTRVVSLNNFLTGWNIHFKGCTFYSPMLGRYSNPVLAEVYFFIRKVADPESGMNIKCNVTRAKQMGSMSVGGASDNSPLTTQPSFRIESVEIPEILKRKVNQSEFRKAVIDYYTSVVGHPEYTETLRQVKTNQLEHATIEYTDFALIHADEVDYSGLEEFLAQIESTLEAKAYYASLFLCLCVPDICSALESADGLAAGKIYKQWFETNMTTQLARDPEAGDFYKELTYANGILSGNEAYLLRCAALHQGQLANTGSPKSKPSEYSKIIFQEPGQRGIVVHGLVNDSPNGQVKYLNLTDFCIDTIGSARVWLNKVIGTEPFETNYAVMLKRYPQGLHPYCSGFPIIT
jgi:hypothetical protein